MRKRFCVIAVVVAAGLLGCDDISSSYPTRAAAEEAIAHGWIPEALPKSAKDIRESHDIDTNTGHGTFAFDSADSEEYRASLTPLSAGQESGVSEVSREKLEKSGYSIYRHEAFEIVIDWNRCVGEFWLVYSR